MRIKGTRLMWLILFLIVFPSLAQDFAPVSPGVRAFIHNETRANAVDQRSKAPIKIEHFEIPYRAIVEHTAYRTNPKIHSSLVFEKNGKKFVRWIIHPEDTHWYKEVEKNLIEKSIPYQRKSHFTGHLQASRSLVLTDPDTGVSFSLKTSTNQTGGNWKDKKQHWQDAKEIREVMDHVLTIREKGPIEHSAVLMDEPMAVGLVELDMAMVVRSLDGIDGTGKRYLPGFSALHEEVGKRIALKNGFENPIDFWKKYYAAPLGIALAELAATTGMTYDSPHGQNFLIELDANDKPTGRVVLRDLGDVFMTKKIFEETSLYNRMQDFSGTVQDAMYVGFGPLHGNTAPSWMDEDSYKKLTAAMLESFYHRFMEVTGINRENMPNMQTFEIFSFNYSYRSFDISVRDTDDWSLYLNAVDCFSGAATSKSGENCAEILKKIDPKKVPQFNSKAGCDDLMISLLNAS